MSNDPLGQFWWLRNFLFALLLSLCGAVSTQASTETWALPSVSISLPQNVPSQTVQISYHLVGPFGGYGGYVPLGAGVRSYEIPATVEGKAATEMRLIVYAPGCEFQKFVVPLLEDSSVRREFQCQHVEAIKLLGQIEPNELTKDKNAELIVTYMARWANVFFGIADGAVPQFQLAAVSPDADGAFEVNLPLNHITSNLEPEAAEFRSEDHCLRILSYYPSGLNFTAEPEKEIFVPPTDVSFKISTEQTSWKVGESITLRYRAKNISNAPLFVPREWTATCPASPHSWAWF